MLTGLPSDLIRRDDQRPSAVRDVGTPATMKPVRDLGCPQAGLESEAPCDLSLRGRSASELDSLDHGSDGFCHMVRHVEHRGVALRRRQAGQ